LARESVAMQRRLTSEDRVNMASALSNLAGCVNRLGHANKAISLIEEADAMLARLKHPDPSIANRILDRRKEVLGE